MRNGSTMDGICIVTNVNIDVNSTTILIWVLQSGRMGVHAVGWRKADSLSSHGQSEGTLTAERSRRSKEARSQLLLHLHLHLGLVACQVPFPDCPWWLFQAVLCIPLLRHHQEFLFTFLHTHEIVGSFGRKDSILYPLGLTDRKCELINNTTEHHKSKTIKEYIINALLCKIKRNLKHLLRTTTYWN